MPDMHIVEREETIEPVAADLRGDTPARRKQLLRYETVRITASVLGLHPDALEQRQQRRHRAAIASAVAVVGSILVVISGVFLRLGLIARNEGRIAEAQTEKSLEVANRLTRELPALFAEDPLALQHVEEAIAQAEQVLSRAVGLYDELCAQVDSLQNRNSWAKAVSGLALIHSRDYETAVDYGVQAVQLQQSSVLANINLGYACLYAGYYDDCDLLLTWVCGLADGISESIRLDLDAQQRAGLHSDHTAALLEKLP